jgi:hypothetical protein
MTEPNQADNLLATLRNAMHELDATLGRTREGVDTIVNQVERVEDVSHVLGPLRWLVQTHTD